MRRYTKRMKIEDKLLAFEILSNRDEGVPNIFTKKPVLDGDTVIVYLKDGKPYPESLDSYLRIGFDPMSGCGGWLWRELDKRKIEGSR